MKMFTLLSVSLAMFALASAFIPSPAPAPYFGIGGPMYGGIGLGLGLGMMGGLGGLGMMGGLGGLGLMGGLGPLGLGGLGLGLGLGTFGPLGNARLGGIRGRRSLDAMLHAVTDHGEIKCELSKDLLNCTGPHEIIQCEVESRSAGPIEIGHFKLSEFTLREKVVNNVETLKILPKKINQRTGHKLSQLSIFENAELAKTEAGFLIKDSTCFNDVLDLVKDMPEKIKLILKD
jgi:hypothetical protein